MLRSMPRFISTRIPSVSLGLKDVKVIYKEWKANKDVNGAVSSDTPLFLDSNDV